MNRKKLWIVLLPLFLLIVAAVLVGTGTFSGNHMVASTPVYDEPTAKNSTVETIADETTPLAGAQPVEPLDIESVIVRVYAPTQTESAPEPLPLESEIVPDPAPESPAPESPAPESPAPEEPAPQSTTATRMLDRAYTLIAQFNACTNSEEKRALLGITNNNFSNDSFRKKILSDMGGSFEQLEAEVVASTEYQQGKTLYVQVYIAGKSTAYEPVVYSTQNSDLSGSQWSTNLVYDDDTATWMEYTKKHPYNDSRVGYSLAGLNGKEDGYDELKDTMESSDLWQPVDETPDAEAPAEAPAPVTEG
ncbi:MAG: hypothetical protein VB091_10220 [Christensenella sp.]|nr:hypothetical protein [Christensenella sp.]